MYFSKSNTRKKLRLFLIIIITSVLFFPLLYIAHHKFIKKDFEKNDYLWREQLFYADTNIVLNEEQDIPFFAIKILLKEIDYQNKKCLFQVFDNEMNKTSLGWVNLEEPFTFANKRGLELIRIEKENVIVSYMYTVID